MQVRDKNEEGAGGDVTPIPVTVRQLEALVRISESLARMQLSTVVSAEHAQAAIQLFHASTLDAVRSGMSDTITLTEDQVRTLCPAGAATTAATRCTACACPGAELVLEAEPENVRTNVGVQKNEMKGAEEQILRRIPIGGYVPEKALVEQLARLGLDSGVVRRACLLLVQREVLEYKKERRVLHRRR